MKENIYNPEFVKKLFNKMSSSYERMNFITSFGFSIRWRKQFLKKISKSNENIEIIDLMTGMGETWNATKNKFQKSNLSALDFSEGMLEYAEKKNNLKFNNEITLLKQNVLENNLPSNHYDIVTCAFGLKTFNNEQIKTLAKETNRILKKSGEFSFIEVSKPTNNILNFFYGFYLGKVIPILGKLLLGDPIEYKMLWKYTNNYKNSKNAEKIFNEIGFITEYQSYFYNCATGFNGKKIT